MNISENLYLNFHAHEEKPVDGGIVIQSLFLQDNLITPESDKIFFTAGLHPWHADRLSELEIEKKLIQLIESESIIAVGEAGLDKLKGPSLELQEKAFKKHMEVAEKYNLPLIIHSVKTHNEILKLKIDQNSRNPWVLHHFNGSKQMAMDLIDHGFYLSLSYHINDNNSRLRHYFSELPIDRIFLETDDFNVDIKEIYAKAASKRNISVEDLKKQMIKNLKALMNE